MVYVDVNGTSERVVAPIRYRFCVRSDEVSSAVLYGKSGKFVLLCDIVGITEVADCIAIGLEVVDYNLVLALDSR